MVRNQQARVVFHEGHQQNKNNDKINISNHKAQRHAQVPEKLRYIF